MEMFSDYKNRAEYDKHALASAVGYSVSLYLAPNEHLLERCGTLAEARGIKLVMDAQSEYGRRAVIYGITQAGHTIPVD